MVLLEVFTSVVVLQVAASLCWLNAQWHWYCAGWGSLGHSGMGLGLSLRRILEREWEVKNNLWMKYFFHAVCTGVSYIWFIILYRHLGQGEGLRLFCECWKNAKFYLFFFFFKPNICSLKMPLFWISLKLLAAQTAFPLFQAACLTGVITLISQHSLFHLPNWEVSRKFQSWGSCITFNAQYSDAFLGL